MVRICWLQRGWRCDESSLTRDQCLLLLPSAHISVPVVFDNYMYFIVDTVTRTVVVVDACDIGAVHWFLQQHPDLSLTAVLSTHHHHDHSGANKELKNEFASLKIFGSDLDGIPALTDAVSDGQCFDLFAGGSAQPLCCTAVFTPCHTRGHMTYRITQSSINNSEDDKILLFTGDCLFTAGCGRCFEGDPAEMLQTLRHLLDDSISGKNKANTLVFSGHEYAIANLNFAVHIDPENEAAQRKLEWCKKAQNPEAGDRKVPTVGSTLAEELEYNPFLRCHTAAIQERYGTQGNEEETFRRVRQDRSSFTQPKDTAQKRNP